ncbi:hypothetical protein NBRC116188_26180 [Oceaniserpentilla sp. 4NH20-0058]
METQIFQGSFALFNGVYICIERLLDVLKGGFQTSTSSGNQGFDKANSATKRSTNKRLYL